MKKELIDRYKVDVEIPDVVWEAEKEAFSKIKLQAQMEREDKAEKLELDIPKLPKKHHRKWLVLAFVAVFALGTLTAGATAKHIWFSSIEEELQISEEDKSFMEAYDMAVSLGQTMTCNGVSVTAEEYITDGRFVYIVFSVDGLEEVTENQYVWLLNYHCDITGSGGTEQRYLGQDIETGKHIIACSIRTSQINSIDGSYAFVDIGQIGVFEDGENGQIEHQMVDGNWTFKWQLEASSPMTEIDMDGVPIGDTGFYLERISFSSFMGNYDTSLSSEAIENNARIQLYGYQMEDGTVVAVNTWGDYSGKRCNIYHGSIIDFNQIEALIFSDNTNMGNIPENWIEDDCIIIELPWVVR